MHDLITSLCVVQASGTRTVISHRRGLRELAPHHFSEQLPRVQQHCASSITPAAALQKHRAVIDAVPSSLPAVMSNVPSSLPACGWVHLECREYASVVQMAADVRAGATHSAEHAPMHSVLSALIDHCIVRATGL